MPQDLPQRFTEWAGSEHWNVCPASREYSLPDEVAQRYSVPEDWLSFIGHFCCCSNASNTKWFLTPRDFAPQEEGFNWNEFERDSLVYAGDDAQWKNEIKAFWDRYMPIFISVDGEYSYYAIDTSEGGVVSGCAPEYEECERVADSFGQFVDMVISRRIRL